MEVEVSKRRKAIFEVLLCAVLWSTGGIFMKLLDWEAMPIAGVRSVIAGLVMVVYMHVRHIRYKLSVRSAFGGIVLCGTLTLFVMANRLTTAANAIVLQYTSPAFIVVFSAILYRKRPAKSDVIAVLVTLVGISLFFLDQLDAGHILGNICGVLSGVCFAMYYMFMEGCPERERMSTILNANVLTFLISVPFIVSAPPTFDAESTLVILALGIVQLGIPYVILANAVAYCPPLACSLLGMLEPLLNPVWVLIFDGERPGVMALIGGVIVIAALSVWVVYNDRKERAEIARGAT